MRDLTQLSINSIEQIAVLPQRHSISSRSSDSIFDKPDKSGGELESDYFKDGNGEGNNDEDEQHCPKEGEELKNDGSKDTSSDEDSGSGSGGAKSNSISNASYPSDLGKTNSDLELDFILPQQDNEDFLQVNVIVNV